MRLWSTSSNGETNLIVKFQKKIGAEKMVRQCPNKDHRLLCVEEMNQCVPGVPEWCTDIGPMTWQRYVIAPPPRPLWHMRCRGK